MRNRSSLLIAAALAAGLMGPQSQAPGRVLQVTQQGGGGAQPVGTLPGGGIGTLLGDMLRSGGNAGGGFVRPKYQKDRGPGHLAAKRLKRKRRNKLRAKGQFRQAVR
jgi:hypothetical protein